jgi:hypothetical protein
MAKQDIRGDTPKIVDEQMSDLLLIMDKKELSVRAVSEIGKDGKAKTVPADKRHQNDFLKIDWTSNIVSNFLSNFWNQAKDPTRFRLLKLNFSTFGKFRNVLKDLAAGKDTPEVKEFLEKYEIRPSINNKNEHVMANQTQTQQAAGTGNSRNKKTFRGTGNCSPCGYSIALQHLQ